MDMEQDRTVRFKPYSTGQSADTEDEPFNQQMEAMGKKLEERQGAQWKAWMTSTGSY